MDESIQKLQAQLDLCKERMHLQQSALKENSTKGMSLLAFASSILLLALNARGWESSLIWPTLGCFVLVAILGLVMLARRRKLYAPHQLSESERGMKDREVGYTEFLTRIAKTYREATEKNSKRLGKDAQVLNWMIGASLAEIASALWLFITIRP